MTEKTILLATRPLVPPWDEASKNFAYFLGRSITRHTLNLLTTPTKLTGLSPHTREIFLYRDGRFDLAAKWKLFSFLRAARQDFDVTHYLFTPTKLNTCLIKYLARPTRGKTLQTIATLRSDLYSEETLRKLLFADHLVVYSDRTKDALIAMGFHNVTRIYPGVDLDLYRPGDKDASVLKEYSLTTDDFLILYPGEYTRLGATDFLMNTFTQFFSVRPDSRFKFLFACRIKNEADRLKRAALQKLVHSRHLENKILFQDSAATVDMPALYRTADVVIFPVADMKGKFDVPLIIIEAYACAKPVILSDLPQFSEFANKDICVTIPKDSGEKLIESLLYLEEKREDMVRLGENARRFVKDHFDLMHTTKQYEEIYDSLL